MDETGEPRLCNGLDPETAAEASATRLCNGLDPGLAAATAELVRQGLADLTKLGDQLLGAVLVWALDAGDIAVHGPACLESDVRSLLCHWCSSLLLRSPGARERWRVVHEADCLLWARYQQRAGGYTALPSGELWRGGSPWPAGASLVLANQPGGPCGAVVTWRGPYSSPAGQEAAANAAVRKGTGRAERAS